jgi:ABC-type transport system substrate-binding protein
VPPGQQPYPHDPEQARQLLAEARWPTGRALRLAAPADLEGVARLLADSFTSSLGVEAT